MIKPLVLTLIFVSSLSISFSQKKSGNTSTPTAMTAADRLKSFDQRNKLEENSLVKNVAFRNVGPTIMSGRVVDIDVSPTDPTHFYVAYASGGLWFTDNNGISFTPIFDKEAVMTIGDIAVDWSNNIIYVGTGENNSSRSSYSGVGIYKSTDNGKTWTRLGLEETHHTGRIILHPSNPDIIWVASIGHLYTPNKERGIFKSLDGGKTWKQTLFIDDNTGCIDLTIDSKNPNTLYTSAWHRERRAWNLIESGSTSGIYKSTDGGETWSLTTAAGSGFAQGDGVGRIGLAVSTNNSNLVYAVLDNQTRRAKEIKPDAKKKLEKDSLQTMSKETFLALDDELLNDYLDDNDFPEKYSAKSVKEMVRQDKIKPSALFDYVHDANALLFDTEVTGPEIYRTDDAGKTWKKMNEKFLDNIFYTYGYYFGQIRISPFDDNEIYIGGVTVVKSTDAGKTFKTIDADNMHGDYHAYYIDPNRKGHIIIGNDGGLNISYDGGKTYFKCNTPAVGQFYGIAVDMEKPYNVYGGLQDNGVWTGPSSYEAGYGWYDSGQYPYKFILGGDGMKVQVDTRDNNTVYSGFQFGYYYRIDKKTTDAKPIQPRIELGELPLRFNWQTPIQISKFNQDIIYFGSNKFHRSFNKGDDWQTLSGDLTQGGRKGDVAYGTITTIDESPKKFGLIYVGSDDGLIHVTKDGGNTWNKISDKLPQNLWVSRVFASNHKESRVYCSLNAYRNDNFTPYIYTSDDEGTNWTRIGLDLPNEPVNVIKEDPKNENILYVGTDNGLYVSLDRGKTFMHFSKDLPAVAVHDLVIHPRDNDIVVGTHGRSIYIASVDLIQQLNDTLLAKDVYVFNIKPKMHNTNWGKERKYEAEPFNKPSITIPYYAKANGITTINIKTSDGKVLKTLSDTAEAGLNFAKYDITLDANMLNDYTTYLNKDKKPEEKKTELKKADDGNYYLQPSKYTVEITTAAGAKAISILNIKATEKHERGVAGESEMHSIPGEEYLEKLGK
ncbi:MAG: glycosyl hydrolase [Bacteroidia bacterium]